MKYDFRSMNIGDVTWFPRMYTRDNMNLAGNAARNFAKNSGDCTTWKFKTKKVFDESKQREGIQIQRIK